MHNDVLKVEKPHAACDKLLQPYDLKDIYVPRWSRKPIPQQPISADKMIAGYPSKNVVTLPVG